jgi:hypothetical protein
MLYQLLMERLIALGGVQLGRSGDRLVVRRTPVGAYMTGATSAWRYDDAPAGDVLVVQPNFDIVFLAPEPSAEAALARFAERVGHGVGTLFRLTRASVFEAAAAGLTADELIGTLQRLGRSDVPANVAAEVRGWFDRTRRVTRRRTTIVECPDEETALRVLAAAGKRGRRLGPTVVELPGRTAFGAVDRKLKTEGIFPQDEREQGA